MRWRSGLAVDLALASLAALLSFAFLYYPMASTPLVPGIDGPYYVVQVRWLLERGELKYPDPPFAFYAMACAALALGDLFAAVEVTSALVTALAALPTYALVRELTGSRAAGFAAALALAVNPFTVRLSSDFMKNSMGLLWLSSFVYLDSRYVARGRRGDLAGALASLALCALTHILDYGVALLYASLLFALSRGGHRRRALPGAVAAALSLAALAVAPFVVGGDVWKGLAFLRELAEYGEVTPVRPDWLAMSVGLSSSLVIAAVAFRGDAVLSAVSAASGLVGLLLNLPVIPPKWLFRFRLMTAVPLAHGVGVAVASVPSRYRPVVAALLLSLVASMGFGAYRAVRPSIPPPAYSELERALEVLDSLGLKPVVPDVRLRYWAETISDDVYGRGEKPPAPQAIVVLRDSRRPPPHGRPVFNGRFILTVVPGRAPRRPGVRP